MEYKVGDNVKDSLESGRHVVEPGRGLLLENVLKHSYSVVWKREEDTEK